MNIDQQRQWKRWLIPGVVVLAVIGLGAVWLLASPDGKAVQEQISGETPQAKLQAYDQAILRGDKAAALSLWELPQLPDQDRLKALSDRRAAMTDTLIAGGFQAGFTILHIEWWGTCCEPSVLLDGGRDAGGARMLVQFLDKDGQPVAFMFDIFVRDLPYWGSALNYPLRQWAIRDIYPQEQEPLFWRLVYKPSIEFLPFDAQPTPTP